MNSSMRRVLVGFGFAAVLVLSAGAGLAAEIVEKILVRVNDRLITNSEFERRVVAAAHAPNAATDQSLIKKEVLQDMIKEKLLEGGAKEVGGSAAGGGV